MLFPRRQFFIRERASVLKLTDTYDILDPETKQNIGLAKDEPPSWAKFLRLLVKKPLLPTTIHVYEHEGAPPVLTLQKRPGFLHQTVTITYRGREIGKFKSKLFSLGGGFHIFDSNGNRVGEVKGNWKGWTFKLLDGAGHELGVVTKKWAGIGKELFTTADNYMVALNEATPVETQAPMILAAGLAVDVVYKEAA
jgi:uncharacterized protein YxjI